MSYFKLVRSKRGVYHPGFEGTLDAAEAKATALAVRDRAGVSVLYYPPGEPQSAAREVSRVSWSKKQGRVLPARRREETRDNPAWAKVFG